MIRPEQEKSLEETIIELYASIKSEICPHSIRIDDLKKINIYIIVEYLKQSIEILINHRLEKKLKIYDETISIKDSSGYEQLIKKLESEVRNHIKVFIL
jgi:hypothetical protein